MDLSESHSETEMNEKLAQTFRATVYPGEEAQGISEAIRAKGECLVILDNVEQLVDALAPNMRQWMDHARGARFLLTSRERVKIEGEHICYLQPLPKEDAIALFEKRAQKFRPGF